MFNDVQCIFNWLVVWVALAQIPDSGGRRWQNFGCFVTQWLVLLLNIPMDPLNICLSQTGLQWPLVTEFQLWWTM